MRRFVIDGAREIEPKELSLSLQYEPGHRVIHIESVIRVEGGKWRTLLWQQDGVVTTFSGFRLAGGGETQWRRKCQP
jgi:hypothetical protein